MRVGKVIQLQVEAESAESAERVVEDMFNRFLSNHVIENATVEVL